MIDRTLQALPLRAKGDLGEMEMKGYTASPKLQHNWSLPIRLFCVISKKFVVGVLSLCKEAVGLFYSPSRLGKRRIYFKDLSWFDCVLWDINTWGLFNAFSPAHTYILFTWFVRGNIILNRLVGWLLGVMVKAMEFELQSRYYIHFLANTLGKGMNPLLLPAMG